MTDQRVFDLMREIRRGVSSTDHGQEFLATAARREGFTIDHSDDVETAIIVLAHAGWTWNDICFING
jgi:hypothetical protein